MKLTLLPLRKKRKKSEKCNEIFCFTNIAFFFFFWLRERDSFEQKTKP